MYVYVFEIKIHYFGQDCILYQFNLDCQIKKVVLRKWNWNIKNVLAHLRSDL